MDQTSNPATSDARPLAARLRRRFTQFSIRSLLLLTLAVALLMSLWIQPAIMQRNALAALKNRLVYSYYDFGFVDPPLTSPEYVPRWLVETLGVDCFADVVAVRLQHAQDEDLARTTAFGDIQVVRIANSPRLTDAGIAHLHALVDLEVLDLQGSELSADGVHQLCRRLKNLRALGIASNHVHDAGLTHLRDLKHLDRLDLGNTDITDAGMAHLSSLTGLVELDMSSNRITDAGLVELRQLSNLRRLDLSNTRVTDQGIGQIRQLSGLTVLSLADTRVTDSALVHICAMENLELLDLSRTEITDAGVESLYKLKRLKKVWLMDSKVTAYGPVRLRNALPNCKVNDL